MDIQKKKGMIIIGSIIIGLLLIKFVPMLYFFGLILCFIILFGQNYQSTMNIGKSRRDNPIERMYIPLIMLTYLVAGVLSFFF